MDIFDVDKLLLFLFFVVPGFVCLKTYQSLVPGAPKASSEQIIDAVACSCVIYAVLAYPIFLLEQAALRESSPKLYFAAWAAVLLIAPVALAVGFWRLRKCSFTQNLLPHPTGAPWDYVFSRRQTAWVIATLTDGRKVGGRFGKHSFASSTPCPQQLYLERAWLINEDGGLERERVNTAGILILPECITTVEFFHILPGEDDEQGTEAVPTSAGPAGLPAQ